MENSDIELLKKYLADAQSPDNEVRKAAEAQLLSSKNAAPEDYCVYLFNVLMDQGTQQNVRVLCAILLRTCFLATQDHLKNLWGKMSQENREFIEKKILDMIAEETDKVVMPHLANLLSEIIGSLYEIEDQVRMHEPHELCKQLIESGNQIQVLAALNIYIGMFDKISEQMMEVRKDLLTVFNATLSSEDHEISFHGLKAACKLVIMLERKDSEKFSAVLEPMIKVTMDAFDRDDEDTLEKCLVELKNLSSAEPKFFLSKFEVICQQFGKIMGKKDYDKKTIRILPIEFVSTIVIRLKTAFTKNVKAIQTIVEAIYNVMIDIDEEIPEEWLYPEDGCNIEEEEFSVDPAHVGSKCIDSFIRELGATLMMPIIKKIITSNANRDVTKPVDWRITHANLMLTSLFGEYIDNIYDVEPYVQNAMHNYYHENAKVRYAAFHVIGQMSTDLQPAFQAEFGTNILKTMINSLDDTYPKLKAHACASLTNFLEGATDDIVEEYISVLVEKLFKLIIEGSTMCKENAVSCLATVAQAAEDKFKDYYEETMKALSPYLVENLDLKYYQFKGQLIESVVIICVSVGMEVFEPHADELIRVLLQIQKAIFDETGVNHSNTTVNKSTEHHVLQSYLLTAWEKLCYLMGDKFVPYLEEIVPTLLKVASLNSEYKSTDDGLLIENEEEETNIVSSETDEKTSALQMIEAFVNELKGGFAPYVEPASQIILPMLAYKQSETIRSSAAKCMKGLMACVVQGCPDNRDIQVRVAEEYISAIWEATKAEKETEILGYQCHALRDVIKEMNTPFMSEDVVNTMCKRCIEMINNSDKRKLINEDYTNENVHNQGEDVDHQDVELMEMENDNEDEFQISISEIFGALFKTHREHCGLLCATLFNDMLPQYLDDSAPDVKKRFSLYVIVDLIEFLEYDYIKDQFEPLVRYLFEYAKCDITVLRQSALYGIGMAAVHCTSAFHPYLEDAVKLLRRAVEIKQGDQEREEFLHCRDNAISSIGKIIKEYGAGDEFNDLICYWIEHMPIQMDLEEGKHMNQLLADLLTKKHEVLFGENYERLPKILNILGEQLHDLYMHKETISQFGKIIVDMKTVPEMKEIFDNVFSNLGDLSKKRINNAIKE